MSIQELEKSILDFQKEQCPWRQWTDEEVKLIKEILTPFVERKYSISKTIQFLQMVSEDLPLLVTL